MSALKRPQEGTALPATREIGVVVEVPMVLPSVANLREHWAVKAKRVKRQRGEVMLMLRLGRIDPRMLSRHFEPAAAVVVTLTRIAPRALDDDNLRGAFKAVRDEVAAYFGVNDNDPRIEWRYAQERGKAAVRLEFRVAPAEALA